MIGVAHTNPARPNFLCHVHGDSIRLRTDHQTKTVVAVNCGGARRRADQLDLGSGIDSSQAEHVEIAMQPGGTVRINPPQVGARQHVSSLRGVLLGHAKVEKYASAEFAQGFDGKKP
jgi:hypothetical protein